MKIDVSFAKLLPDAEKVKAIVNLTLDDTFAVHGLKVIEADNELFVSMPNIIYKEIRKDTFHPVTKEARDNLSSIVLQKYKEKIKTFEKTKENHNR